MINMRIENISIAPAFSVHNDTIRQFGVICIFDSTDEYYTGITIKYSKRYELYSVPLRRACYVQSVWRQ